MEGGTSNISAWLHDFDQQFNNIFLKFDPQSVVFVMILDEVNKSVPAVSHQLPWMHFATEITQAVVTVEVRADHAVLRKKVAVRVHSILMDKITYTVLPLTRANSKITSSHMKLQLE